MEWDNYRKIQYFGGPLAAKYTWDNPFQTTSQGQLQIIGGLTRVCAWSFPASRANQTHG